MAKWNDQSTGSTEVVVIAFLSLTPEFTNRFDEENSEITVKCATVKRCTFLLLCICSQGRNGTGRHRSSRLSAGVRCIKMHKDMKNRTNQPQPASESVESRPVQYVKTAVQATSSVLGSVYEI